MNIKKYGAVLLAALVICASSCGSGDTVVAMSITPDPVPDTPLETQSVYEDYEIPPAETIMAMANSVDGIQEFAAETDEPPEKSPLGSPEETTVPRVTAPVTTKEKPITNRIYLQGPNMVYVGESFHYTSRVSSRNADRATILWSLDGDAGTLSPDGEFFAEKSGIVTLTVSDVSNGFTDSLTVHCVESPLDVDFVVTVNGIPIANKTYPVPRDYAPELSPEVEAAFYRLAADAKEEDLSITFNSGFRSFEHQMGAYGHWTELWGIADADRVSARPGHSEHQLGLAIDVCNVTSEFASTPEAAWLAENCYRYGFILRYPSYESEPITGYAYEPWHIRYLGEELAADVTASGLTLEEYLGIDSRYRLETFEEEFGFSIAEPEEEAAEN